MKLSVNIDHIATIRQARMASEPDPVYAAALAEMGGADGITIHLRQDRRHIQERDVEILRRVIKTRLNMEMAASMEMVKIALKYKPDVCTLVPEGKDEVTTGGGLDIVMFADKVQEVAGNLMAAGIGVSMFIDPGVEQVKACHRLGIHIVELNTGDYAINSGNSYARLELDKITKAVNYAKKLKLHGPGRPRPDLPEHRPHRGHKRDRGVEHRPFHRGQCRLRRHERGGRPHEGAAPLLKKERRSPGFSWRRRPGRTSSSTASSSSNAINNRPLPSFYKKGVFHLHSTFSDGLGTVAEICRDASRPEPGFRHPDRPWPAQPRIVRRHRLERRYAADRRIGILAARRPHGRRRLPRPGIRIPARAAGGHPTKSRATRRDLHLPSPGRPHPLDRLARTWFHRHRDHQPVPDGQEEPAVRPDPLPAAVPAESRLCPDRVASPTRRRNWKYGTVSTGRGSTTPSSPWTLMPSFAISEKDPIFTSRPTGQPSKYCAST